MTTRGMSEGIRHQTVAVLAEYFVTPAAIVGVVTEDLLVPVVRRLQERVNVEFPSTKILINYRKLETGMYQLGYVIIDAKRKLTRGETVWLE